MVANISSVNGKNEAFTALTPAWWDSKREYMTDQYLTSEQVWGERGLLNFEYELRALKDAETGKVLNKYRHCVRKDTNETVGCGMTDQYKIVQPREAFSFLDDLMRDGLMKYASAGVLGKGEEIWILGLIPSDDQPIKGETHNRYVLWTDRFDAGGSIQCFPCTTRVECANTLAVARRERDKVAYKGIRHSGDMQAKLVEARETLIGLNETFKQYNADCRKLIGARYSPNDAKTYIETLFPTDKKDSKRAKTQRERKVQSVRDGMRAASSNIGEMKGTWYQLFNAVSFAVDHGDVFRFRGDKQTNQFKSLMTGPGADLKSEAFELALSMGT